VKRVFVAVDVDQPTRSKIAGISAALQKQVAETVGRTRVSWVHPDRLHLTLEFLGAVDPATEERLSVEISAPFSVAPFDLAFAGVGFFPLHGPPRVLWLGIADGLAGLRGLHAELRGRLADRVAVAEVFRPHLTLARFRGRVQKADLKRIAAMPAAAGPCKIDRVTLYESHLSPKGPTYRKLTEGLLTSCM